jgi:hypothetical protein
MRREAVVEAGGVGIRFIEEEGRLAVAVVDVLAAAGYGNASATWSRAREHSDARLEAREVRYETKLPGKKSKIVVLPLSNMADVLSELAACTHGHGQVSKPARESALNRVREWLLRVNPFDRIEAGAVVIHPAWSSTPLPLLPPEPAYVEVLPAVEPAPVAPEVATPEEILAVLFEGKRLRLTPETPARVSRLDVLAAVGYANPSRAWEYLKEQHAEVLQSVENFNFPGQGQRSTPVVSKRDLLKILGLATGSKLAPFKEWSARTLERYLDGDPELAAEVLDRAER